MAEQRTLTNDCGDLHKTVILPVISSIAFGWQPVDDSVDLEDVIFTTARKITDAAECERYVQDSCGTNVHLAHRVRLLLRQNSEDSLFLEPPVTVNIDRDLLYSEGDPEVGSTIGSYELMKLLGAGGMGLVFLARQNAPVRRQVALKTIRSGMATQAGVLRFQAEYQTLAQLNHPHIARLLDVGKTEEGRPWFVMELAQGLSITDYCRQNLVPMPERLRLFESVCDAVDLAHQQGVLHRDLKPSNILITIEQGRPVPKVIDFGVATVVQPDQASIPDESAHGSEKAAICGTPAYMSPEQIYLPDHELDARCDVYSLGILLYELMTDSQPFQGILWQQIGYTEIRRVLNEVIPPVPSQRVQSLLEQETLSSHLKVLSHLKGDLDWIIMKAIEKDRQLRYTTVAAFSADIKRYRIHEPVEARPASYLYRLKKLLRRRTNRLLILSLACGVLLLLTVALGVGRLLRAERFVSARNRELLFQNQQLIVARDRTIRDHRCAADLQTGFSACQHGNPEYAGEIIQQWMDKGDGDSITGFEWYLLQRLCTDTPDMLAGVQGHVYGVAFSPDGRLLASGTGGATGCLQIWDVSTGESLQTLQNFDNDLNAVCFNSDGSNILTAEETGRVRIWDSKTGQQMSELAGFESPVSQIVLASNDRTLMASEVDWKTLASKTSVWDLVSLTRISQLDQHRMLDVSKSQDLAAMVSNDGKVSLRRFSDLGEVLTFSGEHCGAGCGCLSSNGNTVATGNKQGTVRIWRRDTADSFLLFEPRPYSPVIRDVAWLPGETHLLVACSDGVVQIWHVASRTLERTFNSENGEALAVDVSQDHRMFAVGYRSGRIALRDLCRHAPLLKTFFQTSESQFAVAVDTEGARLAILDSASNSVVVRSLTDGGLLQKVPVPDSIALRNLAFPRGGQELWATDEIGTVFRISLKTEEFLRQFRIPDRPLAKPVFSDDGRYLAFSTETEDKNTIVGVWDVDAGRELARFTPKVESNVGPLTTAGFVDDSTLITFQQGGVSRWNFRTQQEVQTDFRLPPYWVWQVTMSPDRELLAVALANTDVNLIDCRSHRTIAVLHGHTDVVTSCLFSPTGRTLVTATDSGEIRLWHIPTAQLICQLPGIEGKIRSLWFTTDERRLFAAVRLATGDHQIMVWDASVPDSGSPVKLWSDSEVSGDPESARAGFLKQMVQSETDRVGLTTGTAPLSLVSGFAESIEKGSDY